MRDRPLFRNTLVAEPTQAQVNDASTRDYNKMMDRQTGGVGIWEPDLEAIRQAKQRRDRIAEGFAFALASHDPEGERYSVVGIAKFAVAFADALIAELDRA